MGSLSVPHTPQTPTRMASGQPQPIEKRRRIPVSDEQRRLIRIYAKNNPRKTQKDVQAWFQSQSNRKLNQAQISRILSEQYARVDQPGTSHILFRAHKAQHQDLDEALFQWYWTQRARNVHPTGDMLKEAASKLWDHMPQYRDQPRPAFSNGWLEGFRRRRGLKKSSRRRGVVSFLGGSRDVTEDAGGDVDSKGNVPGGATQDATQNSLEETAGGDPRDASRDAMEDGAGDADGDPNKDAGLEAMDPTQVARVSTEEALQALEVLYLFREQGGDISLSTLNASRRNILRRQEIEEQEMQTKSQSQPQSQPQPP